MTTATACGRCKAGDHAGCTMYEDAHDYSCVCVRDSIEHRRWVRQRWPDPKAILWIADLDANEDSPAADPEYLGGLGSGAWHDSYRRHEEKGGGYSENDLNPPLEERDEAAEMEER